MFICFLGTGCRFGEMASLCWEDINWERRVISINKTIRYFRNNDEHIDFHIAPPKTRGSTREIPMLSAVENNLKEEYERQKKEGFCEVVIDGFTHFVWTTQYGKPYTSQLFDRKLQLARERYNKLEEEKAKKEAARRFFLSTSQRIISGIRSVHGFVKMKKISKLFSLSWDIHALPQRWASTINAPPNAGSAASLSWTINSESDLPIYQNSYQNTP